MRAVVFQGAEEPMTVEDVDRPEPDDDGILVETEACGICRSDWHAWRGDWEWIGVMPQPGLVFGHEPVGRVVEVGDNVDRFAVGDRVTNPFNLGCGSCHHCRDGRGNICETSIPMGFVPFQTGAFAEYYSVRNADFNAVTLPEEVDPVDVAGLGCRFATAFHGLVHRVDVTPGDWVAIHGCGGVGLSAVHVADALGANVIAVDLSAEKLARARDLGADRTVEVGAVDDVPQAVKKFTESSRGADVAVDALGIAETCRNAVNSLGKGGQHLQIGMTTSEEGGEVSLPVDTMVTDEREFYGAYGIPPNEYDEIFRMMGTGKLEPGRIVSETVSLEEVPGVVEGLGDYETVGIPVCDGF
ncbi:zinc-dependent alcohol dehydrogenase family protein [Haloarchaeobius sp. FL176]|uniref:zinc-dependent alcohol dehydrogenase family protein n=1 Tax=Haloarchaeobius sp. FL176 TaxID=2967129 RepID=UPI002149780A|nr:zinc-dependent alcohol dehydrogenase family protein [Haloarchaeobius sp. FL176]